VTDMGRVTETKTGETREVDLSPRVAAALTDLRVRLEADALVAGRDDVCPWVFATRAAKPPNPHRQPVFHRLRALTD